MTTLSVIIPVFNEEETILPVIEAALNSPVGALRKEIIIVDDFSTDGTREILSRLEGRENVSVLLNESNKGKGFCLRRGLAEASGDIVIIQDADLEYDPNEYHHLIKPILDGEADVVYGSRFKETPFSFRTYYLANMILTCLSNIWTGLALTDMETCYKCFSKNSLKQILPHLKSNRFEIEPEITAVVARLKLKLKEIPISYYRRDFSYFRDSYQEGKKIGWKDGIKAIIAIIKS